MHRLTVLTLYCQTLHTYVYYYIYYRSYTLKRARQPGKARGFNIAYYWSNYNNPWQLLRSANITRKKLAYILMQWEKNCIQHTGCRHTLHMITHHPTLQGSSEGTGSPKAYSVPFTSQLSMGTQVMLGQHCPGVFSITALVPKGQSTSGQGWKTGYR